MQTAQNWHHMLVPRGSGNKTSSGILDHLQSVQQLTSDTDQQTVAVVQSAADESVHKFCCHLRRHRLLDRSQLMQLEKAGQAECSTLTHTAGLGQLSALAGSVICLRSVL